MSDKEDDALARREGDALVRQLADLTKPGIYDVAILQTSVQMNFDVQHLTPQTADALVKVEMIRQDGAVRVERAKHVEPVKLVMVYGLLALCAVLVAVIGLAVLGGQLDWDWRLTLGLAVAICGLSGYTMRSVFSKMIERVVAKLFPS